MSQFKILVAEDEPDVASAIKSYLGRRGFGILSTSSGLEALSLIEKEGPDLLILDLALRDLGGLELLRRLRTGGNSIKVIVLTGQLHPSKIIEQIAALGVAMYVHKPFSLATLFDIVTKVLGQLQEGDAFQQAVIESQGGYDIPEHRIANLLSIMRNKCENFVLDIEDGVGSRIPDRERLKSAVHIMSDVMKKIDQVADLLNKADSSKQ